MDTGQKEIDEMAFNVLTKIYEEIAEAYKTANEDVGGYTLRSHEFESNEQLDDHINQYSYRTKALCFAIGWHEFSPDKHAYSIDLRWNYGTILDTRMP